MWVLMRVTVSVPTDPPVPRRRVDAVTEPRFPAPGSHDIALSVRTHDRVGERRVDEDWLARTWKQPSSRIVPVAVTRIPVVDEGEGVRWQEADDLPAEGVRIFLGDR